MAILNRQYGYLFLAEPYCASRAVGTALAQQEGSVVLDTWVHNPHSKLCDLGFVQPHEQLFKFSIVRNPADYLVTKYHHLTGWHVKGFQAFLRSHLELPETLFMHAGTVDLTLRYEHLASQLNDVLESRGAPPVTLSVIGPTKGKHRWQTYYSPETLIAVSKHPDFNTYGFTL